MTDFINNPTGFPYLLFQVEDQLVTACTDAHAIRLVNPSAKRASAVDVLNLIQEHGHKKTNQILKKFGESWVCKNGKIFYKQTV